MRPIFPIPMTGTLPFSEDNKIASIRRMYCRIPVFCTKYRTHVFLSKSAGQLQGRNMSATQ